MQKVPHEVASSQPTTAPLSPPRPMGVTFPHGALGFPQPRPPRPDIQAARDTADAPLPGDFV